MPTSIFFHCPGCNARIKAPVTLLGRWRCCPGCNKRFVVRHEPRGRPDDAEPVLVADDRPDSYGSRVATRF
jgi:hypothetical protein